MKFSLIALSLLALVQVLNKNLQECTLIKDNSVINGPACQKLSKVTSIAINGVRDHRAGKFDCEMFEFDNFQNQIKISEKLLHFKNHEPIEAKISIQRRDI